MITTGSKLLVGSAAAAWIFAAVYGIAQDGTLGTLGLVSAAVGLSLLAGINMFLRDSNVSAMDHESFASSAAAQATARPSLWPLLAAIGAIMITLGLVTYRTIFVLGVVAVLAATIEWLILGWSERASKDPAYNADARDVLVDPLELPVAGAIGAAVVVYSFSRVMLGLPNKSATVAAFAALAASVLAVATLVGFRRNLSKATLTGAFSVVAIVLVAGGAVAGLNGERETHPHHTTGDLAADDDCVDAETEADENASQSVAGKSSLAAELTWTGEAVDIDLGFEGNFDHLTLPRSTPSNIMFRNESDRPARLAVELYPERDASGVPTGPDRLCSALVEEGGAQFLTVEFSRPSFALDQPYEFTVVGEDASVEVVVP